MLQHWLLLSLLVAQICGFTTSTPTSTSTSTSTSSHDVADQFGLPFLLASVRQEVQSSTAMRSPCQLTFSVDELAEAFYDDLLRDPELLDQYRFHVDHRQYANELLLLEYFRSSPCRIRDDASTTPSTTASSTAAADDVHSSSSSKKKEKASNVLSSKQVPHYYIVFIPFKCLLLGLNSRHNPPMTSSPDQISRLSAILHRVFTSKSFLYDREHYLYVYTATFHFDHHFIAHLHKDFHKLLDHRVVRLGELMDGWMH